MKRLVYSAKAYKRKNIPKEEWNEAVRVGKEVLEVLHEEYPDLFPFSRPKSVMKKSAWSDKLYVLLDIGVRQFEVEGDLHALYKEYEEVVKDVISELGIDPSDFQVYIDYITDIRRFFLVVYDMNTNSEIE